jgi:hypothetical protein
MRGLRHTIGPAREQDLPIHFVAHASFSIKVGPELHPGLV